MRRFRKDKDGQWWYHFGKKNPCRMKAQKAICRHCGKEFLQSPLKRKDGKPIEHCSRTCGVRASYARQEHPMAWRGENSRHWEGGRKKTGTGYMSIYSPGHPSIKVGARKYVLEHRLVMEKHLGRFLTEGEFVHHKNGVKDDNRIENLELWNRAHPWGQRAGEQAHCPTCTCFGGGA
jgi:hypothetical protein